MKPNFTVIIPIHNKGLHLVRSINSVLNQSFQDFEILLINDASTDNSANIIQQYSDSRIRKFKRDIPGPGGYAARNLGIKNATGKWVCFLDADDEWMPQHLEKMHQMQKMFSDVKIFSCGWKTQYDGIQNINNFYKKKQHNGVRVYNFKEYLISYHNKESAICTDVICIKNEEFIQELFPSHTLAKRGGDLHTWVKLLCKYKRFGWSNHIGAIYYLDSINMTTKTQPYDYSLFTSKIFDNLSENLTKEESKLLKINFNDRIFLALDQSKKFPISSHVIKQLYFKEVEFDFAKKFILLYLKRLKRKLIK